MSAIGRTGIDKRLCNAVRAGSLKVNLTATDKAGNKTTMPLEWEVR